MTKKRDALLAVLTVTADTLARHGFKLPPEYADWMDDAIKTARYYDRVMWSAVRDAYNGLLTPFEFEEIMLQQISSQFRRGFMAGLRELGINEITPKWEQFLQDQMSNELSYVQKLMDDIRQAALDGKDYDIFRSRVKMWANRFDELYNQALIKGGQWLQINGGRPVYLIWRWGATEEHCLDCKPLNGVIKTAQQWASYPAPRSRALDCGGYRCDCSLSVTMAPEVQMLFAPEERRKDDMLFAPRERR